MRKPLLTLLTLVAFVGMIHANSHTFTYESNGIIYECKTDTTQVENRNGPGWLQLIANSATIVGARDTVTQIVNKDTYPTINITDRTDKENGRYIIHGFYGGEGFKNCTALSTIDICLSYVHPYYDKCSVTFTADFPHASIKSFNITGHSEQANYEMKDGILYNDNWHGTLYLVYCPAYITNPKIKIHDVDGYDHTILPYAFSYSKAEEILIPGNYLSISQNGFYNCNNLKTLIIPERNKEDYSDIKYIGLAGVPLTATIFAPKSQHTYIKRYWNGEHLYDYPPKPEIGTQSASDGLLKFEIKQNGTNARVDSVKIDGSKVEFRKVGDHYEVDVPPIYGYIYYQVFCSSDMEPCVVLSGGVEQTGNRITLNEVSAEYGQIKLNLDVPEWATIDSIDVYGNVIWDIEHATISEGRTYKGKSLKKSGNEYTMQFSPILNGEITFMVRYSMDYNGKKLGAEVDFRGIVQEKTDSFNDACVNATYNSKYEEYTLDSNYINMELAPDFSHVKGNVEDYGYYIRICDWRDYRELERTGLFVTAKDKKTLAIGPLVDTDYVVYPYVVVDGVRYSGNGKIFECPRLEVNPTAHINEPGRLVLSPGFPFELRCDTISSEWVIDGDTIIVDNDSTVTLTDALNMTKNLSYAKVRYQMQSIFGPYKSSETWNISNYLPSMTFTTPKLQWTTLKAKSISNTRAVIAAEVNISNTDERTGFEWRRCDAPDLVPSEDAACPVVNGTMSGLLSNLSANTYYQYRPYYQDSDNTRHYGEWIAFGTADAYVYFEPMVSTFAPARVTETTAMITGYALAGSDDIIEQGFEYQPVEVQSRAMSDGAVRVPATGERMVVTLTDLQPATTYSIRAYAVTAKETTYGEEQTFTTAGILEEAPDIEEPGQDGIIEVSQAEATTFNVYNLSGMCVRRNATDMRGLRPGIYIVNGRKLLVK